ncbi:uncharacterized protein BJ212DRAFT_1302448 [Suillus subaureus]|uniref:Uncharacterized protein n=1 Tax=Suillus subaureus TaxID=48587 RepID=A0A9P7E2S8_9AGAM|nr:uncharacterized protein BJ212DRAFT_1302448 [Suillus subaureus]KAG1809602.1 hypothetical protein BJ212DRAFT_1302448 [Suillus subaureus]
MGIKRVQCDDDDDNDDNKLVSFEEIAAACRKAKDPGNAACSMAVMKLPAAEDLSYHSPHHSMQPLEHSSDADNDSVLLEQSLTDFPMGEEFPAHLDINVVDFMNDSVEEQRANADHNNKILKDPLTGTESSDKQPEVPPSSVQVPDVQPALPVPVNELLEPLLPPDVILNSPKELDSNQLQFFMKDYVDDLLRLYDKGIIIKTSKYPEGQHVHVIPVAVCCNHPVMCKLKLKTEDAMEYDKFPCQDGQQH